MPNLSLKGVVNNPALVVAPTKVKGGTSILIDLAPGPSPMIKSIWKSSMAEYKYSSITLDNLWISSINRTSFGWRFVRIAAKSPVLFNIGPDVVLILTFNSDETICAKVVFPNPGGPCSNIWSIGSSLSDAALINVDKFPWTFFCPMKSSNFFGLNAKSNLLFELSSRSWLDIFSSFIFYFDNFFNANGIIFSIESFSSLSISLHIEFTTKKTSLLE